MRFCFDRVFDDRATQEDVYEGSAKELVQGVLDGFNATVFAYGVLFNSFFFRISLKSTF